MRTPMLLHPLSEILTENRKLHCIGMILKCIKEAILAQGRLS